MSTTTTKTTTFHYTNEAITYIKEANLIVAIILAIIFIMFLPAFIIIDLLLILLACICIRGS
jgi:hypothetical protein